MIGSRAFRALMRRNLIYRKRNWVGSLLEILLPVGFICILVAIKVSLQDSDGFAPKLVEEVLPDDSFVIQPLSFTDYLTAVQAERKCYQTLGDSWIISGIPFEGYNWQVPLVKCDSRSCTENGENARTEHCEYNILAVAPEDANDSVGEQRASAFQAWIEARYPQILSERVTELYTNGSLVVPFESNQAIESYVRSNNYGRTGFPKIAVAVVFATGANDKDYAYTLRVNSTNYNSPDQEARPAVTTTPNTDRLFENFARNNENCEPEGGAPEQGPLDKSCTGQYIYNGAVVIQRLVGDWILNETGARDNGYFVSESGVQFVSFPAKAYTEDGFYAAIAQFAPLLVVLGLLYPVAAIIRSLTQEKEFRQKELMKMMSVTESDIGWSWFLSYFLFHLISTFACAGATTALYENSDFFFLFFFWFFTFIVTIVFAFAVSSFISKSTRATLVGLLLFFIGYFLTLIVDVETGNAGIIRLLSLHPVAAFSFGLQEIGRLEDLGVGVTSSTFNNTDTPSGYTFENTIGSFISCAILWGIVSWYLNRVVPADFGTPLKWYFPFTQSYWCPSTSHAPKEEEEVENDNEGIPSEPVSDALQQQSLEGKCVDIHSLRKQYGEKTAVDGLSLSMYSGQVTALLGHNGAGKTTTINMLTGMVAPTEGHAVVAGKDIRTQMSEVRQNIGICLQHDCLFPLLTVKEHIQFFARIKGMYARHTREEAEAKVLESIEDVALLEKRNTFSKNLSGGMKRKLSVAIAFCGDSKTVLLDEPTSGMDPFSRRFTWNVIRHYRQDRCIILTTHFMDEADILGDRIAIMAEGQLRCVGSPLFLKKAYGVGYQLTIEKNKETNRQSDASKSSPVDPLDKADEKVDNENGVDTDVAVESLDGTLKKIVTGTVPKASLLSNVGTEMSFQLPLDAASDFKPMFEALDDEVEKEAIATYGVSITTLDEVFLMVARGETGEHEALPSSVRSGGGATPQEDKSARSRMDLEKEGLFSRHVQCLFAKRALNFKRDKKAWCCSTILPSIFVLIGLLAFKFGSPTRDLEYLDLTLVDYNPSVSTEPQNPIPFNEPGIFTCSPGVCMKPNLIEDPLTNETYSYCGAGFLGIRGPNPNASCSIVDSETNIAGITEGGAVPIGFMGSNTFEASESIIGTSDSYLASQYGALYFTHEVASTTESGENYGESVVEACKATPQDYVDTETQCDNFLGLGYVVSYNFTALHNSLLYQSLADESLVREATGDDGYSISASIWPMPITRREQSFGDAEDSFSAWFLICLSFPFIAATFGTFVVAERASKAKHLQTVSGVKPGAYWISSYLWDIMNYQLPMWIVIILFFAFGINTFTTSDRGIIGGVITLMILFGPAAAGSTYCISFAFDSPSMCNLFVIIFNFLISLAGPLVTFILRIIGEDRSDPKPNLINIANALEWVLRPIPSFCLGKGLFNTINIETFEFFEGEPITVWNQSVLLWEVIFLALESVAYIVLAIQIDKWSANPQAVSRWNAFLRFITCQCCCSSAKNRLAHGPQQASLPDDEDVLEEQQRILSGGANDDLIVLNELTKRYPNGKLAVDNISFGIPPGQCFGLLGINGAGKTSTMGVLTAEFPPTSGDATLAGFSVTREPEQTRRRIGYCPQFDAHFANMTGREHVEMYAAIKGVPKENIREAADLKLTEVGLNEFDRERLSAGYSGGMKRKLSVACATVGQPQIVFLDEPSTGMDPVARRDLWQVISDMVSGGNMPDEERTSVILTTHSMEECEALCPRIAIMATGKLRCLGSAQHLKTRFGQGFQVELKLKIVDSGDEDYKSNLVQLQTGTSAAGSEEGGTSAEETFVNLAQALDALKTLSGDDYLANMVEANDPTGYIVYKSATSESGVSLDVLASFATEELRMRNLQNFVQETYPNSVLRERQDGKARYEVSSEGVRISNIFASIEENKERMMVADYGVSQTSLEQVFNMHAAEAEKLKQGTVE